MSLCRLHGNLRLRHHMSSCGVPTLSTFPHPEKKHATQFWTKRFRTYNNRSFISKLPCHDRKFHDIPWHVPLIICRSLLQGASLYNPFGKVRDGWERFFSRWYWFTIKFTMMILQHISTYRNNTNIMPMHLNSSLLREPNHPQIIPQILPQTVLGKHRE